MTFGGPPKGVGGGGGGGSCGSAPGCIGGRDVLGEGRVVLGGKGEGCTWKAWNVQWVVALLIQSFPQALIAGCADRL